MRICVSGPTGLVGRVLVERLRGAGHDVLGLSRSARDDQTITWQPQDGRLDPAALQGVDAVVHLAGDNIAQGRWNDAKKARIRESRVQPTRLLADTMTRLSPRPQTLVCASATGYYGDRGDELLTESSPPGDDFLADVCQQWEAACQPAVQAGIRVVNLRTGVVLSPAGGMLGKILTPFRMGVGGVVGTGKQYMSWIALDDLTRIIERALHDSTLSGPVNAVAPHPVTNYEFTKTLGRVLRRPTIFPLPVPVARLALGEMADALLLSSARVVPARLQQAGFTFEYPTLEEALRSMLR